MPEGDSIFRTARTLHRALAGEEIVRFESMLPALTRVHEDTPITGRTVDRVTAAGKHVLMFFSGPLVLRTHMRMNGSWHLYRPGETWHRPRRDMRIVVATRAFEAIAFSVPVAEFLAGRQFQRQPDLRSLGPDLLGPTFDATDAIRRFREHQTASIADTLINQRVVAGAGNVYKSEVLFLCGINPFLPVRSVSDEKLLHVLETARKHLQANVTHPSGGIVTYRGYQRGARSTSGDRLYVYGRASLPCRRCGRPIHVMAQGPNARLTYWCPSCQPDAGIVTAPHMSRDSSTS
jgi:endonuclease-8